VSSKKGPKILFLDIETAPILADVWQLFDNNVSLNQIVNDWSILAWAAKWRGQKKIFYQDTGNQKNVRNDKKILPKLWKLMEEADIIVGQNSKRFDVPKINARFIINQTFGHSIPTGYRQHDTMLMAKSKYSFTSFKLEYMAKALGLKNQKMVNRKFNGHDLWRECLNGNKKAWKEMRKYNPIDLKTTEELYEILLSNDSFINFNSFYDDNENRCSCGSFVLRKFGFRYTNTGKFQDYKCQTCGKRHQSKYNLLSKIKRKDMLK
jgi:hypothetical protein